MSLLNISKENWAKWNSSHKKTKTTSRPPVSVGSSRDSNRYLKNACMAAAAFMTNRKAKQANAGNTLANLLRGTKIKCSERGMAHMVRIREANAEQTDAVAEGRVVDVVLITEGLGNRRNMNYYGPEAIESAPGVFEGKPCFLDHPSESEERDIPERRVRQKCGYFKKCRIESINNTAACIGELHFDLSEDGEQAYRKACTALHYKSEFPGSESEYVGLSINADGDVEDRTVEWQGETLQVNYVTKFRDAMSCDIVTSPARGGRFLALVESAAGAKPKSEEVGPMKKGLKKALEAAQTALEKATKENDFEAMKKATVEADKLFKAFLKEAAKAAYQKESEDEQESDDMESGESKSEDENESESEGDSHTVTTHKVERKTGKAAVPESEDEDEADDAGDDKDDDAKESKRVAIASMAREAGLDLPKGKLERLALGSMKEARAEIADLKWMQESVAKKVLKQIKVPVATLSKVTESERESDGSEKDFLASCVR